MHQKQYQNDTLLYEDCKRFSNSCKNIEYQNAIMYIGLRKFGCPKTPARKFSQKTICRADASRMRDGPPVFRNLKVKPEKFMNQTANGWKLSRLNYEFDGKFYFTPKEITAKNEYQEEMFADFVKNEKKIKEDCKKEMDIVNEYIADINKECQLNNLSKKDLIAKIQERTMKFKKISLGDGSDCELELSNPSLIGSMNLSRKPSIGSINNIKNDNCQTPDAVKSNVSYDTASPVCKSKSITRINCVEHDNKQLVTDTNKNNDNNGLDLLIGNSTIEPRNKIVILSNMQKQNLIISKIADETEKINGQIKKQLHLRHQSEQAIGAKNIQQLTKEAFQKHDQFYAKRRFANQFNKMNYLFEVNEGMNELNIIKQKELFDKGVEKDRDDTIKKYLEDMHQNPITQEKLAISRDNLDALIIQREEEIKKFDKRTLKRSLSRIASLKLLRKSLGSFTTSSSPQVKKKFETSFINESTQYECGISKSTNFRSEISRIGSAATRYRTIITKNKQITLK